MSTYLVLHGGATSTESPDNDKLYNYFTSLVDKDEVKILMCYFAREESRWHTLLERDVSRVLKNTKKKVEFCIAKDPKDLLEKLEEYDVLYVAGGAAKPIEPLYSELEGLKSKLEGKVYIGSSMGAFMMSENYVLSPDAKNTTTVHRGLGIIQFNCLVHWDLEPKKKEKIALLRSESDLPILTLDEGESIRFVI